MKRWNLVDKRRVKKATRRAHSHVRECKNAYKAWQRTKEPDSYQWSVAHRQWSAARGVATNKLRLARARAQDMTQFSSWLNDRLRGAYINEGLKRRLLKEFAIEAVTMLADLVADGP